jgi:hypothetical protein
MTMRIPNDRQRRVTAFLGAFLLTGMLTSVGTLAQESGTMMRVEHLRIDHRNPSRLREALLPLLSGSESIGVIGDWLIVAATDGTRNRIRDRLETLDTPIRRMDITLSFTAPVETGSTEEERPGVEEPETIDRELTVEPG